jgi:endoglucanase
MSGGRTRCLGGRRFLRSLSLVAATCGCLAGSGLLPAQAFGQVARPGSTPPAPSSTNRLGLPDPVAGNPLAGAQLYVDPDSPSAQAEQDALQSGDPTDAALLNKVASQPGTYRFYMWNLISDAEQRVASYMQQAANGDPGSTVLISTYSLVHGACDSTATPAVESEYDNWINQVAQGIGDSRVVFFLEIDSIITAGCLTPSELAIREAELSYAVQTLEADPHVLVYIDAGAGDAQPVDTVAQMLKASDVADAQGFFVNATHYDWTNDEIAYGEDLSDLLGGAHFIINTGDNGQGPLTPPHPVTEGNEVLCNPIGRGLGPLSVIDGVATQTSVPNLDGLLWTSNPGGSGGNGPDCQGPDSLSNSLGNAVFWPAYAEMLAQNESSNFGPYVPWQPQFAAKPQLVRFSREPVRTSTLQTVTVTYLAGNGDWTLGQASIVGTDATDFAATSNGCLDHLLKKLWTCQVAVQFTPHHTGRFRATLDVAVNAPSMAIQIPISGSAVRRSSGRRRKAKSIRRARLEPGLKAGAQPHAAILPLNP